MLCVHHEPSAGPVKRTFDLKAAKVTANARANADNKQFN